MRSRIKQNVKKQNTKTILIIVSILFVLIIFGTQILIGFSLALDKLKGSDETEIESSTLEYIAPPFVDPLKEATKDDTIEVVGSVTLEDVKIELFVNNKSAGEKTPNSDNTFKFTNIKLLEGENTIKAKTIAPNGKKSAYSETQTIKYLNKEPTLEISTPQNGQTFKKDQSPIKITGKTDPGARVTVNDFWAITSDNGDFYYMFPLKDGGNNLKIKSVDEAGNEKSVEININVE